MLAYYSSGAFAMTINLPADIEAAVTRAARRLGTTPESVIEQTLRQNLPREVVAQPKLDEARDEWEKSLRAIAIPCGVSLSNEALSSEGLYD
jgi:predicted transcriptional regulator